MPRKGCISPQQKEVSEIHKERIWGADTCNFAQEFSLPNFLEPHLPPHVPCTSEMQTPPSSCIAHFSRRAVVPTAACQCGGHGPLVSGPHSRSGTSSQHSSVLRPTTWDALASGCGSIGLCKDCRSCKQLTHGPIPI